MSNPFTRAKKFVLGLRAGLELVRNPHLFGQIYEAREDRDTITVREAFASTRIKGVHQGQSSWQQSGEIATEEPKARVWGE